MVDSVTMHTSIWWMVIDSYSHWQHWVNVRRMHDEATVIVDGMMYDSTGQWSYATFRYGGFRSWCCQDESDLGIFQHNPSLDDQGTLNHLITLTTTRQFQVLRYLPWICIWSHSPMVFDGNCSTTECPDFNINCHGCWIDAENSPWITVVPISHRVIWALGLSYTSPPLWQRYGFVTVGYVYKLLLWEQRFACLQSCI